MSVEKIRKSIRFHGDVQGVGFRYKARFSAAHLGLTGWVKNEYDGTVLMEVQGLEGEIDMLISSLMNDRYIVINNMDVKKLNVVEDERHFRVRGY